MAVSSSTTLRCRLNDLGLVRYQEAYAAQQQAVAGVLRGELPRLFFCEHNPIFTLGRLASEENFLLAQDDIKEKKIAIERIDRGGEVTFHGPGQLVIYPVLPLKTWGLGLKSYMQILEELAVDFLRSFDIVAYSPEGLRGVWTDSGKIASIGIGVKRWVSFHGMALNVNVDLDYFKMIRPCGLTTPVCSMASILGKDIDMNRAKQDMTNCFAKHFNATIG